MRRLFAWLAVLGLLGTVAGCYKGRGICDCLDYRDPCCYYGGPYGYAAPPLHDPHLAPVPVPPPAGAPAEPLKVMPKEIEKSPPKDSGTEAAAPVIE
ncbi:MAG TPA: hypothetical protein VNK04_15330 [Gemmataceae bacterium]|nr:hypothetical protein [Gemmataceae bacterium]